ncbi:MAG TPA: hypothetical protein VLT36_18190, partial [Candidatus Dormibacteraeota bacterium]|nr:hypothetical protein [Candidatus Dormibacteraeota bacterium]
MDEAVANYRLLDSQKIIDTVQALQGRIERRFPGSGLGKVCAELFQVAQETVPRAKWIQEAHLPLRLAAALLSVTIIALLVMLLVHIRQFHFEDYTNSIQAFDASISSIVFIGAAILFLVSWENKIKRHRALKAIHELRALAHIIDMHQLTKDPESYFAPTEGTAPPVKRRMTPYELNRYLDYCSDMMALISKIAALYVQGFQDPALLDAVDDVEDLTAGFSRKIWQKLTILENLG